MTTTKADTKTVRLVQRYLFFFLYILSSTSFASQNTLADIMDLPFEELLDVKVSTVSRKMESLREVAAAVFVISQEDIRRSSANSIPELLRMAPGLSVARIDANKWSVTSRGFSGRFADDLLVMVDGRTVYSPLVAGTFWETIDIPLEDIERIEVIRGPSGTIWGANAANGAIHIITKHTRDTQGGLVSIGGGTEERGFATLRYGGKVGDNLHYRVYSKGFSRDKSFSSGSTNDDWQAGTTGLHANWDINERNAMTLQGQYYGGKIGQRTEFFSPLKPDSASIRNENARISGGHALLRWAHKTNEDSNSTLQVYYDYTKREELSFRESRHTVDVDFQQQLPLHFLLRHDILWGGGYRWSGDDTGRNLPLTFNPAQRSLNTVNVFMQDEMSFLEDKLRLTLGLKFLKNTFTNGHFLPNTRLLWAPDTKQSVWASATRSIRLPSRLGRDGSQISRESNAAEFIRRIGNSNLGPETLWGFEIGYRRQITSTLSFDFASFFNDYKNSDGTLEVESDTAMGLATSQSVGQRNTQIYGFEVSGEWRVMDKWRLIPTYNFLQIDIQAPPGIEAESGEDPSHLFTLRSQMELGHNVEFDAFFRYVDRLPGLDIASYKTMDLRLGWKPVPNMEFSLVGQNLLQSHHQEFIPELIQTIPTRIQRGVFGRVTWRF